MVALDLVARSFLTLAVELVLAFARVRATMQLATPGSKILSFTEAPTDDHPCPGSKIFKIKDPDLSQNGCRPQLLEMSFFGRSGSTPCRLRPDLGARRDQGMLAHDVDVDLAVFVEGGRGLGSNMEVSIYIVDMHGL